MARPSVLLVTYYFPPMGGGGVQRPAKFVKYLSRLGWDVHVLTTEGGHYDAVDESLLDDVSGAKHVIRAPHALAKVKSAIRRLVSPGPSTQAADRTKVVASAALSPGKQRLVRLALDLIHVLPEENFDWYWPALAAAGQHFRRHGRPDVVFSTALPITSNFLGWALSRELGCPWVAEYRDLWTSNPYHKYLLPTKKRLDRSWERRMLQSADMTIAVTPRMVAALRRSAPSCAGRIRLLRNGYDGEDFQDDQLPPGCLPAMGVRGESLRMIHVGRVYLGRDPVPLFRALAAVYSADEPRGTFKMDFYGPPVPEPFRQACTELGIGQDVTFRGYVSHREITKLLSEAHVKVVIESAMDVLPGKIYEYVRSGGHVLVVCEPDSALAAEMAETGCSTVTTFAPAAIERALGDILGKARDGTLACQANEDYLRTRSRAYQAAQLDAWMRQLIGGHGSRHPPTAPTAEGGSAP